MAFSSVSPLFLTRTLLIELGLTWVMGFPGGTVVKNPPANAGDIKHRFDPWVGKILGWKIPWIEEPGRLHGVTKSKTGLSTHTLDNPG